MSSVSVLLLPIPCSSTPTYYVQIKYTERTDPVNTFIGYLVWYLIFLLLTSEIRHLRSLLCQFAITSLSSICVNYVNSRYLYLKPKIYVEQKLRVTNDYQRYNGEFRALHGLISHKFPLLLHGMQIETLVRTYQRRGLAQ